MSARMIRGREDLVVVTDNARKRTAARLWMLRRHLRMWIKAYGYDYQEASKPDTKERRQAVQEVRDG